MLLIKRWMQAWARVISLLLLCALVLQFAGCSGENPDKPPGGGVDTPDVGDKSEQPEQPEQPDMTVIDSEYVIIYEGDSARARKTAAYVKGALEAQLGASLKMRKDTSEAPEDREILVGKTNREYAAPFASYMGSGGWAVSAEGARLIIQGATGEALAEAAEYFISRLTKNGNGDLIFMHTDIKTERKTDELAAADITLRVATFNIKNGSGVGHVMAGLAELITPLELDVVGLQEVDVGTSRAGGLDTLKELAEAAGYPYYSFSPAIDYRGGKYGHGIMSKYPIASYETVELTTPDSYEQRVYGHAVIQIGEVSIDFYNTHLSFEDKDTRGLQFTELNAAIGNRRGFILTADFNTDDLAERELIEGGALVNRGTYATFPSKSSGIDDIIVHGGWDILSSGMVEVGDKSDHNLLWTQLHFVG